MSNEISFWKTMPRRSQAIFLLGVFFLFSTVGSSIDVIHLGQQPVPRYLLSIVLFGGFASIYALLGVLYRERFWKFFFPILLVQMVVIGRLLPDLPRPLQLGAEEIAHLQNRLTISGATILAGMVLAYICFLFVFISEGRRYFRVHAEMELARDIHRVLVPGIDLEIQNFSFCGRSEPSGQVGGDLIDVFADSRGWIAYVADVSGHGVAPGVLMGMVKSAARMQLSSTDRREALLQRLHRVLFPIKKPEMFVTFAYLEWDGQQLQYALAGHPSILHCHAGNGQIDELPCDNAPIGFFEEQEFVSRPLTASQGDLFLLCTDGLLEIADRSGEEFGMVGIKSVLEKTRDQPLEGIVSAILGAAQQHGHTVDDQSLLLVRCGAGA